MCNFHHLCVASNRGCCFMLSPLVNNTLQKIVFVKYFSTLLVKFKSVSTNKFSIFRILISTYSSLAGGKPLYTWTWIPFFCFRGSGLKPQIQTSLPLDGGRKWVTAPLLSSCSAMKRFQGYGVRSGMSMKKFSAPYLLSGCGNRRVGF